jgi:hypothetical protein
MLNVGQIIGCLLTSLLFSIISFSTQAHADVARRSHCSETIPTAVQKIIQQRYPGFHILTKKESRHGCPGIAKVDVYGDGRTVYAIVILTDRGSGWQKDGKLILAKKDAHHWEVEVLDEGDGYPGSLWHEPAGLYGDRYGGKTLKSKGDVIIYFGYESWERAYGWTGEQFMWVQLSD